MDVKQYLNNLRNAIATDDLSAAFLQLRVLLSNSPLLDQALLQSARWHSIHRQIQLGSVSPLDARMTENQIRAALLELLREIETQNEHPKIHSEVAQTVYNIFNGKNILVNTSISAGANVHIGDVIHQILPQSDLELTSDWFKAHVKNTVADLHDRYSPKEHFDLPMSRLFSGLVRNEEFKSIVSGYFHEFLKDIKQIRIRLGKQDEVKPYSAILKKSRTDILDFFEKTSWHAGNVLDLEPLVELLNHLDEKTDEVEKVLREKRRQILETQPSEKRDHGSLPFGDELYYLREIRSISTDFRRQMESEILQLASKPCLLLTGKAGYGKSHLLGDTAFKLVNQGLPIILVLGNKLVSQASAWQQILASIGLHCTSDIFLEYLNEMGRQADSRALLMIDALNEGEGKNFWKNYLASFIQEVEKYPFVGLVLTVRDTYVESVVPQTIIDSPQVVKYEHRGFEGYELEAVKHFCSLFKLEQPRFPILSPEFTNPQLLLLLCKTLGKKGQKNLPEGLSGVSTIYDSYLDAVNLNLAKKHDYPERNNLVRKSLEYLATAFANAGTVRFDPLEVERIFREFSPEKGWSILQDLLYREGVLAEDRIWDFETDTTREVVRFGYERLGDFIIARQLIETHIDHTNPVAAFQDDGFFAKFFEPSKIYRHKGLLEAVAVLLPERFGLEIVEAFAEPRMKSNRHGFRNEVVLTWIDGLRWRKKETIDLNTFMPIARKWIRTHQTVSQFQYTQLALSIIPEHPLNADRLHASLLNISMAERDYRWSPFISEAMGASENPSLQRIFDWIWSNKELDRLSSETVRLTCTLLAWCFASSNNHLRDKATLSAVRLLDERPETLLVWLQQFEGINDLYIQERLFAVALGVTLRIDNKAVIAKVAQYVYDYIFGAGNPPIHILLRDYARTTVEYALHLSIPVSVDASLIRPPYGSRMPKFPSEKKVKKYEVDYKSEAVEKDKQRYSAQGSIVNSVLHWDFNRYVIEPHVNNFCRITLSQNKKDKKLGKGLPKTLRANQGSRQIQKVDHGPVARWILHRVFELGWQRDWHGHFDYWTDYHHNRGRDSKNGRTERIGKKYQWIAFHEVMACLADNHYISEYGDSPQPYQGPWQPFLRDIDPTFPLLRPEFLPSYHKKAQKLWWQPFDYNKWTWHHPDWIDLKDDLPDPVKLTEVVDSQGITWLSILNFPGWDQERNIGESNDGMSERRIWYHIRGYIIREEDEIMALDWLSKQRFYNETLPDQYGYYELFEREMYWSSAYQAFCNRSKREGTELWSKPKGGLFSFIIPAEEYEGGGGGFGLQGSHMLKPASFLWDKLGLQHGKRPGEFWDQCGNLVFQDPATPTFEYYCLLAHKDIFLNFLRENKLTMVWTILGEKQMLASMPITDRSHLREIHGVMRILNDGSVDVHSFRCTTWMDQ